MENTREGSTDPLQTGANGILSMNVTRELTQLSSEQIPAVFSSTKLELRIVFSTIRSISPIILKIQKYFLQYGV
jgi:hypothetical protein